MNRMTEEKKEILNQVQDDRPKRSLFVVGDDAQSIYGFRGSKIEIILNFEREYPGAKEIILNQNYRSTQPILDLAEQVLTHNPSQKKKELFTERNEETSVCYYMARNERDEAEYIIKQLHKHYVKEENAEQNGEIATSQAPRNDSEIDTDVIFETEEESSESFRSSDPVSNMFDMYMDADAFSPSAIGNNYNPKEWQIPTHNWDEVKDLNNCAILYRTHSQSRSIEETFLKNNVPYRLVSGVRFLDRKEIKDVLAILKFLANGEDKVSLNRFLPLIMDGVGPKTMDKIIVYLQDFEYPLPPRHAERLMDIMTKMQSVWTKSDNLIGLTKELISSLGYQNYLKKEYPVQEDYETRMENIGELYSLMHPFEQNKEVELPERLQMFLNQVSLMTTLDSQEEMEDQPKINLMSLHQSKGLEFETVFLVGVEDGLLPHQNSLYEPGGMEEEVRLSYVGVTRSMKHLHLISAESRIQFGQVKANPVSRIFRPFIDSHCQRGSR